MKPEISIIVPVYNVEPYLERCVSSILNQTLKNIEIILVDDGSPDNCPAICDVFAQQDDRIKVVHKKNGGLGLARNSGIEVATGRYISFIDSDDYVSTETFQKLLDTAIQNELDACYYGFTYILASGKKYAKPEVKENTFFHGKEAVDSFLLDMVGPVPSYPHDVKYSVSACKAIYSLDIIRNNNLEFVSEREIASEDLMFQIEYLHKAEHVGILPDCFYHYCENTTSISHTFSEEKRKRILKSMIFAKAKLSEKFPEDIYLIHYQRCLFLSLRGLIRHEVLSRDNSILGIRHNISQIFASKVYDDLFVNYPYSEMDLKHRLLFLFLYKKAIMCLILIFKLSK